MAEDEKYDEEFGTQVAWITGISIFGFLWGLGQIATYLKFV
jgi:hypothetical protein